MKYLTIRGQTRTVSSWAQESGVSRSGIDFRLTVLGWDPERAVFTPNLRPIGEGEHARRITPKRRAIRFKTAPTLPNPILPRWGSVSSINFRSAA